MKKKMVIAAAAAVMAGMLTGCGGGLSNEYVTVTQYKGLEVPQASPAEEVSEDQVEQMIQANLQGSAEIVSVTDRAAKMGDWVNIDYAGYTDGEAFEGGTAQAQELQLGAGRYIAANGDYKGFEEQIAGHETGDEFDITVRFPDDYYPEMAGKVAEFHIVLNEIYTEEVPELTDEWVKENSEDAQTVDEYREEIRGQLEKSSEDAVKAELTQAVQQALIEKIEIKKYPEDVVKEQSEEMKDYYTQVAGMYGMTLEEFISSQLQTTEEDFDNWIEESARQTVIFDEAAKLIAKKHGLELSDEEYEEKIEEYAKDYDLTADEYKEQIGETTLRNTILREKVTDYLIDECIQVEQSDEE